MQDTYVKALKFALENEIQNSMRLRNSEASSYAAGVQFALKAVKRYDEEDQKFSAESSKYQDKPLKTQVREKSDSPFFGCAGK